MDYLLIFLALAFISISQVLQKLAVVDARKHGKEWRLFFEMAARPTVWWAIASLATGTALWLAVLYRMEVSKAFPFLSLGFVLVMLASRYYFQEKIHRSRWIGVALIMLGIILLSRA